MNSRRFFARPAAGLVVAGILVALGVGALVLRGAREDTAHLRVLYTGDGRGYLEPCG